MPINNETKASDNGGGDGQEDNDNKAPTILRCSVCHKTSNEELSSSSSSSLSTQQLLRCSRCKDDNYRLCSKECQAQDWKRHKLEECYVYDAVRQTHAAETIQNLEQTKCPVCQTFFTERDVAMGKLQGLPCKHMIHVQCYKSLMMTGRAGTKEGWSNKEKKKIATTVKCPLCLARVHSTSTSLGSNSRSSTSSSSKPWFKQDSVILIHMALGHAFQAETQGTMEEERHFIERHFRDTIQAGQRDLALHVMKDAQDEFQKLLPTLRTLGTLEERLKMADAVATKVSLALGLFFFPASLDEQDESVILLEQQKWEPHIQSWMETLQLFGPYIWG